MGKPATSAVLLAGSRGVKIRTMPKATHTVLADALKLEPDARAEVAAELLASLDGPADPDAEAAWDVENRAPHRRDRVRRHSTRTLV